MATTDDPGNTQPAIGTVAVPESTSTAGSCLSCGQTILDDAAVCGHCGARVVFAPRVPAQRARRSDGHWVLAALVVVAGLAAVVGIMAGGASQQADSVPTSPAVSFGTASVSTTIAALGPSEVVVTSELGDHHASHLIDGDLSSVWLSESGDDAVLEFRFDRPVIVKEVEFVFITEGDHADDAAAIRRVEMRFDDAKPITLELAGGPGPHRLAFTSRVASAVVVEVLATTAPSSGLDMASIGLSEVRFFGVK